MDRVHPDSLWVEQAPCRPDRGGFPRLEKQRPRSRRPGASELAPIAGGKGLLRGGGGSGGRLCLLRLLLGLLLRLLLGLLLRLLLGLLVRLLLRRLGVGGGLLLGADAEGDEGKSGQGTSDRAHHEQLLGFLVGGGPPGPPASEQAPCRVSTRQQAGGTTRGTPARRAGTTAEVLPAGPILPSDGS